VQGGYEKNEGYQGARIYHPQRAVGNRHEDRERLSTATMVPMGIDKVVF